MNTTVTTLCRWVLGGLLAWSGWQAQAAELSLNGPLGGTTWSSAALSSHPQARDVELMDSSYKTRMRYRAVPLALLAHSLGLTAADTLEVVATDGFVAQLPGALALQTGPAQAWLAIEPEGQPWPALPKKTQSAGPFYVVWLPDTGVRSEQWPYNVAKLNVRETPEKRWPQIQVDGQLPAQDPARRGQALYITQCLVCHTMNRGGAGTMGPDLNLPMNPVNYFQSAALRQLIRNPASVRQWPTSSMPGFDTKQLSEQDLDDLLAYLAHMAPRKP